MASDSEFEWTDATTRGEAAALLRDLADGVEAGEVALDDSERAVTADVPEAVTTELAFEVADGASELEVELAWDDTDDEDGGATGGERAPDDDRDATDDGDAPELPGVLTAADGPSGSLATFEVYRDRADEWRWRLLHDNGNIIADSGEGYARRDTAVNGLRSVQHNAPGADVDVRE